MRQFTGKQFLFGAVVVPRHGGRLPVTHLSKDCATGTLPRSAYLHYLIQDYVFLVHFSRAWSLGVIKADTLDEMKTCARTVDALVNHEMDLHIQTCAAEGIDEEKLFNASEELENLAYTRYVMDAGVRGDFLDLLAALAPCCFGYGEIGARLAQSASAGTPYRDWINAYGSEDYQSVMAGRRRHDRPGRSAPPGQKSRSVRPLEAFAKTFHDSR